jgi:hypothetical protein
MTKYSVPRRTVIGGGLGLGAGLAAGRRRRPPQR